MKLTQNRLKEIIIEELLNEQPPMPPQKKKPQPPEGGGETSKELKIDMDFQQSNIEGEIVTIIQEARNKYDGIIINAAGFTHTSVAIRDAMAIYNKPSIELHISNIYKREDFRHKSMLSDVVTGVICGLGSNGYILAIKAMHNFLKNGNK